MSGLRHAIVLGIGLLTLAFAGAAQGQDLSAGKSPAQLFQLNCSVCHKSPRGLAAAGEGKGLFSGLESFLAEHYTADPKSAAIIAAYLKSVGGAAPAARTKYRRNAAKPHKPAAENSTKTAKKTADKKSENADKTKGETTAKPEDGKAKAEEPAVAKPKPAAMAADKKKPASPSTQAKDGKSVAGDKKAD